MVAQLFARSLRSLTLGVMLGCSFIGATQALELVAGGYGAAMTGPMGAVADERLDLRGGTDAAGMSLDFTPRHNSGGLSAMGALEGPTFSLAIREGAGTLDRLSLTDPASDLYPAGNVEGSARNLTVGGAMTWYDWTIGGGLGRGDFLGTDIDIYSAMVGFGSLSAQFAYGQSSGENVAATQDVLMLSTDLAASSWLTLESDLAVGSRPDPVGNDEDHSVAVGRFGLRLNF